MLTETLRVWGQTHPGFTADAQIVALADDLDAGRLQFGEQRRTAHKTISQGCAARVSDGSRGRKHRKVRKIRESIRAVVRFVRTPFLTGKSLLCRLDHVILTGSQGSRKDRGDRESV